MCMYGVCMVYVWCRISGGGMYVVVTPVRGVWCMYGGVASVVVVCMYEVAPVYVVCMYVCLSPRSLFCGHPYEVTIIKTAVGVCMVVVVVLPQWWWYV